MAEQTFRSPGFFEQEIDLSERQGSLIGIPAGVIGTAMKGPAFVPVTIGTFVDFENRFGTLDPELFGPYAVREFLKHRNAVTYMRVLGAGANQTETDLATTAVEGTVKNAGLWVSGVAATAPTAGDNGIVQFLVAKHDLNSNELYGYPMYTDNSSFVEGPGVGAGDDKVNLLRGVVLTPTGTRMEILDFNEAWALATNSTASVGTTTAVGEPHFKLVISSSSGTGFSNDEGQAGIRIFTASLDPHSRHYVGKVLNTDPDKFQELEHLLYLDIPVENEIMSASGDLGSVGILSGTAGTTTSGGDTTTPFRNLFGRMDTRYTTPRTPAIISQPFGSVEYDLFHFETISDGTATNEEFKVSIANIRKSTDPANDYGIFDVQVRRMTDTDILPEVIEYYPAVNLNPKSEDYIARKIGDRKVYYNFDTTDPDEQRLIVEGKYPNRSINIRVVMNEAVEKGEVTALALPFGFRGVPVLKTIDTLTDDNLVQLSDRFGRVLGSSGLRLGELGTAETPLTASIMPPLPLRFKATRGEVKSISPGFLGDPGSAERADNRYYWGVKFERIPLSSSVGPEGTDNAVLNTNISNVANPLIKAYSKFQGITKLDTLVTGTAADYFNDNKFTLSRVALYNTLDAGGHITDVSGTAAEHMLQAAYVRNGTPDATNYTVVDGIDTTRSRITLGTLVHTSSAVFNRFQEYNKFSTMFYGGFDGVNLLDRDNRLLNDRASSVDTGGKAGSSIVGGLGLGGTDVGTMSGIGKDNNIVAAYRAATKIVTDPLASNINILTIPGIRDTQVTDFALAAVRDYSLAIYLMDPQAYDADVNRLFDDSATTPDVRETAEQFEARAIDNNYGASYFPDVFIQDDVNNRPVRVPSSVAAISALAFNDRVAYPWFAPAGFNRAALADVRRVAIRLNSEDRDVLYDARLNPIATFPAGGFVIFGQKTLQQAKSSLDRVNVRRLLLEVKRLVAGVARRLLFEQNDATTRAQFVSQATPLLALIQSQSGIERFQVVCDETNNTQEDVDANKMNGRIVLVPTRAVEFISIDFIVTNSGVSFE